MEEIVRQAESEESSDDDKEEARKVSAFTSIAFKATERLKSSSWIIDSGASSHMRKEVLCGFQAVQEENFPGRWKSHQLHRY